MGALPSFCGGFLNSVVVEGIVHWVEHHIITGKCQILRICGDNQNSHDGDMSYRFSRALVRSRVMDATKKFITDFKECSFDPDLAAATVMSSKKINPEKEKLCTANLKLCFLSIIGTNRVIRDILVLKDTVFSYDTIDHANLLDALWTEMFPDIRRSTPGLISNEWCADFGFQNSNPSSDFRGMGIFGLHQLEYFARTFPVEARALLMQCQNPSIDKYIPFAATGINMTAFVVQLMRERRLHGHIFRTLSENVLSTNSTQCAINTVHGVYCKLYISFGVLWAKERVSGGVGVMAFPEIFKTFTSKIRNDFPILG